MCSIRLLCFPFFARGNGNHGLKIAMYIEAAIGTLFGAPMDTDEMGVFLMQLIVVTLWPSPAFKRPSKDQLHSVPKSASIRCCCLLERRAVAFKRQKPDP